MPSEHSISECLVSRGLDIYGVWGGTTQGERRPYRKRIMRDHLWVTAAFHPNAAEELEASLPARLESWRAKAAAHEAEMARRARIRARRRAPKALAAEIG